MKNVVCQELVARCFALAAGMLLACAVVPKAASAQSCLNNSQPNLVKNGDFELGSRHNIPDWTVEWGTGVDKFVYLDTIDPHGGTQDMAMGSTMAADDIVQRINGTAAGSVYTICFWLASSPNPTAGVTSFEILWNNISELSLTNSAPFGYQYFAINVLAQGNKLDFLRIRERNKQGFYFIDDVAVQLCPGCGFGADGDKHGYTK